MKTWSAGEQVLASDLNGNFTELQASGNSLTGYVAAETLVVGDPVVAYFSQTAPVAYETKGTWAQSAAGGTVTQSLTCGTGSNRILVVFIMTFGVTPAPTYAGVSMTLAGSGGVGGGQSVYCYYLYAPATGANNLVYSNNAGNNTSGEFFQLTGSHQSAVDSTYANGTGTFAAQSTTVTPTQDASFLVFAACSDQAGTTPNTTTQFNDNQQTQASGVGARFVGGTSGIIAPKQAFTVTSNSSYHLGVLVRAINAPTYGAAAKTSASSPTAGSATVNKYSSFLGFITAITGGGVAGTAVTIQTGGVVTGLSGLVPMATYYLSNTSGTLSLTAGTNSKKVGVAVSTTSLMIKHDN